MLRVQVMKEGNIATATHYNDSQQQQQQQQPK